MTATKPRTREPLSHATAPPTDYPDALRMAVGALAAVGVAFFLCHLPYGRLASVLLCVSALALAGLSLLGLDKSAWVGWVGIGANALLALVMVAFPDELGLTGWWPQRAPTVAPQLPGTTPDGWIDAGDAAWEENGVRVGLTFATVAPDTAARGRAEQFLWVGVSVTNAGPRSVEFIGWNATAPVLTTADSPTPFPARPGKFTPGVIEPGKSAECVLAFAVPPAGQALRLELPATAFGGTTPARFQIAPDLILRK